MRPGLKNMTRAPADAPKKPAGAASRPASACAWGAGAPLKIKTGVRGILWGTGWYFGFIIPLRPPRMEPLVSKMPARYRPALAYPTLGESWGILGWYLLVSLVAGGSCYALLRGTTNLARPSSILVASTCSNGALLAFLRWKAGLRWQPW